MIVYNFTLFQRFGNAIVHLGLMCMPFFIPTTNPEDYVIRLIFVLFPLIHIILLGRDTFCPFIIDGKGITSKLPGCNIFIAWNEFEYIYFGERTHHGNKKQIMCFSKEPHKTIYLAPIKFARQTRKRFYITYREGMLEVVQKYVDECKIR